MTELGRVTQLFCTRRPIYSVIIYMLHSYAVYSTCTRWPVKATALLRYLVGINAQVRQVWIKQ